MAPLLTKKKLPRSENLIIFAPDKETNNNPKPEEPTGHKPAPET